MSRIFQFTERRAGGERARLLREPGANGKCLFGSAAVTTRLPARLSVGPSFSPPVDAVTRLPARLSVGPSFSLPVDAVTTRLLARLSVGPSFSLPVDAATASTCKWPAEHDVDGPLHYKYTVPCASSSSVPATCLPKVRVLWTGLMGTAGDK